MSRMRPVRFEVHEDHKQIAYIDDDDFGYDALIRVHGDFADDSERRKFMEAVCAVLNENEARIPVAPRCSCTPKFFDPKCPRCSVSGEGKAL
jgi:hypothetical protein